MLDKNILGIISIILAVVITLPYLWKMQRGQIRPHIFTWLIWTLTSGIAAAARFAVHAGPGAWASWAAAASCLSVVLLALFKGDHDIKRSDIVAFAFALSAIPAWLLTHNPLIAVIIVTSIDVAGYYPTFRKSYRDPHHEAIFNYIAANALHMLSLLATENYSLASILFPVVVFTANTALIVFVLWRRRCVSQRV